MMTDFGRTIPLRLMLILESFKKFTALYVVIWQCITHICRDPWSLQGVWPWWEWIHLKTGAGSGHAVSWLHAKWSGAGGDHSETGHGWYISPHKHFMFWTHFSSAHFSTYHPLLNDVIFSGSLLICLVLIRSKHCYGNINQRGMAELQIQYKTTARAKQFNIVMVRVNHWTKTWCFW